MTLAELAARVRDAKAKLDKAAEEERAASKSLGSVAEVSRWHSATLHLESCERLLRSVLWRYFETSEAERAKGATSS